jgi:hypothetical protein
MPGKLRHVLLPLALWGSLVAGCSWIGKHPPYPPDPLLVSRKPVEAGPEKTAPLLVARTEPTSPEPPATAVASAPVDLRSDKSRLAGVHAVPTSRSSGIPATPAVRRRGEE